MKEMRIPVDGSEERAHPLAATPTAIVAFLRTNRKLPSRYKPGTRELHKERLKQFPVLPDLRESTNSDYGVRRRSRAWRTTNKTPFWRRAPGTRWRIAALPPTIGKAEQRRLLQSGPAQVPNSKTAGDDHFPAGADASAIVHGRTVDKGRLVRLDAVGDRRPDRSRAGLDPKVRIRRQARSAPASPRRATRK